MNARAIVAVTVVGTATVLVVGAAAWAVGAAAPERPVVVSAAYPAGTASSVAPWAGIDALDRIAGGEVRVRDDDGTWVTKTFAHGLLDEVDGSRLTLTRPDAVTTSVTLDDETRYHGVADRTQLRPGVEVAVVAQDGVAEHVLQATPEQEARLDDARQWLEALLDGWTADAPELRGRLDDLLDQWRQRLEGAEPTDPGS